MARCYLGFNVVKRGGSVVYDFPPVVLVEHTERLVNEVLRTWPGWRYVDSLKTTRHCPSNTGRECG